MPGELPISHFMKQRIPYTQDYFKLQGKSSLLSAEEIIPIILKMVKPKSVVDVGCGVGAWLSVFQKNGIKDIFGIDGEYVDVKMLLIPENKFLGFDLSRSLQINSIFDLVISLEVAEHIAPQKANTFVESLTRLGPVIIFSAAIPSQSGEGHVNEQWPVYWEGKFKRRGYVQIDCIRNKIWQNDKVDWWYAQNTFVYVRKSRLKNYSKLEKVYKSRNGSIVSIVHPKCYLNIVNNYPKSIRSLSKRLFKRIFEKISGN